MLVFLAINTKAILGAVLVGLAVAGGCGARLAGGDEAKSGSITGAVTAVDVNLAPVNTAGWQVGIDGHPLRGTVAANGTYVIADVPAGAYAVTLQAPAYEGALPACNMLDCRFADVKVLPGTAAMHVDFDVVYVPAPPFSDNG